MVEKLKSPQEFSSKYANADETREAILLAALDEFAEKSFEGARTREIAKKANVNHAAINYHFGGKKEIYNRVIIDTVAFFEKSFAPLNVEVEEFLAADGKTPKKAVDLIKKMLLFQHSFFYNLAFQKFYLVMKREETYPTDVYETVFKRAFKPVHQNFVKLVDIATRFKRTQKEVSMLAVSLMGLNGALLSCKTPFLKMNKQSEILPADIELFAKIICEGAEKLL